MQAIKVWGCIGVSRFRPIIHVGTVSLIDGAAVSILRLVVAFGRCDC